MFCDFELSQQELTKNLKIEIKFLVT